MQSIAKSPWVLVLIWTSFVRAQTTFTEVTPAPVFSGGARNWVDYDDDGDLDLFVVDFVEHALYRNDGSGLFTRDIVFSRADIGPGTSLGSWADYDNDGDLDLVVVDAGDVDFAVTPYENNGQGSFTQVTTGAIVDAVRPISWVDYDTDGDLDFLALSGDNSLYRNDGDGTFTKVNGSGIDSDGGGASWGDYDNDGNPDLFQVRTFGEDQNNVLYRNTGFGNFQRVTAGSVVSDGGTSRGGSWGDYDNDGDLDLFVNNGGSEVFEMNFLYENTDNGTFNRVTHGPVANDRLPEPQEGGWLDYDNDGDLDLVLGTAGDITVYENDGVGMFTRNNDVIVGVRRSPIWGDYDNDGDLDFVVTGSLYQNNGNSNNWINIECRGRLSNAFALGAKVRVMTVISGRLVEQFREISGQGGHSLNAEFGLGDATVIDTVRVEWPSRQVQLLTDVAVNQFLTITEVLPPEIELMSAPSTVASGSEVVLEATITATDLDEAILFFRAGGGTTFTRVAMSDLGNDSFRGIISGSEVTSRGVEYRFEATDIAGNVGRLPLEGSFSVQVSVPAGIAREQEEPFGSDQTAYHLFSVPLDLQDKTPASILEDDMGAYDESRWRFLEYVTEEQSYHEFPEIEQLQPGKGYWFLVTEPARVIDTPGGTSFSTAEPFAVLVRSGWNLIGNPFNFNIPASNVRLGLSPVALRSYNGSWNNPISDPVTEIRPFEGYAVSIDDFAAELFIDPNVPVVGLAKRAHPSTSLRMKRPSTSLRMKRILSHGEPFGFSQDRLRRTMNTLTLDRNILWSINVQARCQQARDVDNVLGVASQASESWDSLDYPEPPPMGEYLSVYFARPEWGKRSTRFCTDFRPALSQGGEWEFEVRTNIRDRVELTFAGIETVPQAFDIWLVDEALGLTQNLRRNPHFFVAGVGEDHLKRLKLMVGRHDVVNELFPQQEIPAEFELSQNFPNPFNPVTSIRCGLPREERITLKIFNILGEEVATLLNDEQQAAGFHVAIWDGRDQLGRQVASGVYVYQLVVGDFRETKKMALVR